MESGFYSYGLLAVMSTLVLVNDLRKRIIFKEDILYRIKDRSKTKYLYFMIGGMIPVTIILAAIFLEYQLVTRLIVGLMGIEMLTIWGLIKLSDALITKTHAGKVWYTRFSQTEYYDIMTFKGSPYLVFKRHNSKKQEMFIMNQEDTEPVKEILNSLGIKAYKK